MAGGRRGSGRVGGGGGGDAPADGLFEALPVIAPPLKATPAAPAPRARRRGSTSRPAKDAEAHSAERAGGPGADEPTVGGVIRRLSIPATAEPAEDGPAGHRKRLRQRFRDGGADAIPDYELLEMVLYGAFPRHDTKPLAKRLLARFGSFASVVNAAPERLREVDGCGERAIDEIKLVRAAALRMMKGEIMGRPVLGSWASVVEYLRAAQGHDTRESLRILFLDKKNQLVADEVQQEGTVDHAPVYVREVVRRAIELAATAIVLVHNHPSGDPTPSRADIEMTKQIMEAAKPLGVLVHDHIIVGRHGHASLKGLRLI